MKNLATVFIKLRITTKRVCEADISSVIPWSDQVKGLSDAQKLGFPNWLRCFWLNSLYQLQVDKFPGRDFLSCFRY